jgi:transposase-like protein
MNFQCPVCGYYGLEEEPYDEGCASFEICPSCGTQFGYEDVSKSHEELRQAWIEDGSRWWSKNIEPPRNWNPRQQLASLN